MTKEEIKKLPKCPGIYMLKNLVTNKCYIGQSICLRKRIKQHYKNIFNDRFIGKHLYDSFRRDGVENIKICLLETLDPFSNINISKELNKLEIYYIEKYDSYRNGYNETKGGESELGCNHTPEVAAKISKSLKSFYEKHKFELNGIFYTFKATVGYNFKENYFVESFSRSELSRILKTKGYDITPTSICQVVNGINHTCSDFVFGNSKEECLEKLEFFKTEAAKHSQALAPNYQEYLEYLKTVCDKYGYLPKLEDIAEHYNRAKTTIIGWNKHIEKYIELDKYYNRLKLIGYTNSNIDYKLRETKQMYLIVDFVESKEYILNTLEMTEFFNIKLNSVYTLIKRNLNKIYRNRYYISEKEVY